MKQFLKNNHHFLLNLYFPFYLAAFHFLESMRPERIHVLDCALDHYIPFLEIFIIPYLLWFVYMLAAGFYFMFREKESFCRMMYFGMAGMTLFIIISLLYPNGLELRPDHFARDNVFVDLVKMIYSSDTATNVLPSIHVYNSMGVCIALHYSERLRDNALVQKGSSVLTVLIILSTMFIKQHSVVDVVTGLSLSYVVWELVYNQGAARAAAFMEYMAELRYRKKRVPRWMEK